MSKDSAPPRRRITLERTFDAPIEDVWELWTTKEGLESWWGPDGFVVKVHKLDLRPGGELLYAMIAVAPDQIAYMKRAGMPLTNECRVTFTEVKPPRRLVYTHLADFIPGLSECRLLDQAHGFARIYQVGLAAYLTLLRFHSISIRKKL